MREPLPTIAYASGIAAGDTGCKDGPNAIKSSKFIRLLNEGGLALSWDLLCAPSTPTPSTRLDILDEVHRMSTEIAHAVAAALVRQRQFLVIGGDHSSAIGTWSGAKYYLNRKGLRLGLIWVDAHLDAHTPVTTSSHNIHGMPVAALLGAGDKKLTQILLEQPKILPQDIFLVGVRDYESGEHEFIKQQNVRVYYMDEVKQRSLATIFQEILGYLNQHVDAFGLSIDLDALDPRAAPGTGTPVADGIDVQEFLSVIDGFGALPKFLGAELAEYNPHHDIAAQTERLVIDLIFRIFHSGSIACQSY